ncbi:MAG TPA: hypothetical protein VJH87_02625 [Vicinamibacteria bacterium]|nr:hypothetical protein [Vicinamibacteria bacterium]
MTKMVRVVVLSSALAVLSVAPLAFALDDEPVEALQAIQEIPEDRLLDVGIHIFDAGIPDDEYKKLVLEEKGVFEEIRKSEARWIPMNLKRTLESTGYWGAVRMVPSATSVDVIIDGAIVASTGKTLEIDVVVFDATGRSWLSRRYKQEADPLAYEEESTQEPFQSLYNRIANDLLKERNDLENEDFAEIRRVSELKFASDLAPVAFQDYLAVKKGRYSPARLPAEGDPMMARVSEIRERDHMFIDTLNEYYADLYSKMEVPYRGWRSNSYEEQLALDELNRAGTWRTILGAAAVIGGVIASSKGCENRRSQSCGWSNAGEVAVLGGMVAVMDGLDKFAQTKMNREALKELAGSFDSEAQELLFDVEGEVLRLKGSVETQYASWRQILRDLFAAETGIAADPNKS